MRVPTGGAALECSLEGWGLPLLEPQNSSIPCLLMLSKRKYDQARRDSEGLEERRPVLPGQDKGQWDSAAQSWLNCNLPETAEFKRVDS